LAITGKEILKRGLKTIPNNPMGDNRGIYMQMVYAESY